MLYYTFIIILFFDILNTTYICNKILIPTNFRLSNNYTISFIFPLNAQYINEHNIKTPDLSIGGVLTKSICEHYSAAVVVSEVVSSVVPSVVSSEPSSLVSSSFAASSSAALASSSALAAASAFSAATFAATSVASS